MNTGYCDYLKERGSILTDNTVWSGFTFLVGFLIVFRTSQAYTRFWDGATATHLMRAEWFDAASALVAFCKHSKTTPRAITKFQQTLIRLVSILHAVALSEIEDTDSDEIHDIAAFEFELLDAESIDDESLRVLRLSHAKTELVFQWVQQLIVENIDTGVLSIPPPILSRAFQELANGMVAAHEAIKISTIPFPFPYAQACDLLLVMHWLLSPLLVAQWVSKPYMAAVFCFVQVFIMWALNQIAVEIENPFGDDDNDLDAGGMQHEMNEHLRLLVEPSTLITPTLVRRNAMTPFQRSQTKDSMGKTNSIDPAHFVKTSGRRSSMKQTWHEEECSRHFSFTTVEEVTDEVEIVNDLDLELHHLEADDDLLSPPCENDAAPQNDSSRSVSSFSSLCTGRFNNASDGLGIDGKEVSTDVPDSLPDHGSLVGKKSSLKNCISAPMLSEIDDLDDIEQQGDFGNPKARTQEHRCSVVASGAIARHRGDELPPIPAMLPMPMG